MIPVYNKKSKKAREFEMLLELVDLYLRTGKPIGSNTFKEESFPHVSSATIRNHFVNLESEGYLKQHHSSGGRVPTDKAYRFYAKEKLSHPLLSKEDDLFLASLLRRETRAISAYLQAAVEALSELTGCAAFIGAPRFDQDFIVNIKILKIDETRALCAIVTDFGLIHTETLYLPQKMDDLSRIEQYFQYRLNGQNPPHLSKEEEAFAKEAYNEVVLRHFISYANMQHDDVYKGGFSKLLLHPEFHDPLILANTLSLFENTETIRNILQGSSQAGGIKYWIGDDLKEFVISSHSSSIIVIPYRLHQTIVGAIAILGPVRIPYRKIFGVLEKVAEYLSEALTKSLYKFKITYRQPQEKAMEVKQWTTYQIEKK